MSNGDTTAAPLTDEQIDTLIRGTDDYSGLTKREYFAAAALQGFCANRFAEPTRQEHFDNLAADVVRTADALLKALASSKE